MFRQGKKTIAALAALSAIGLGAGALAQAGSNTSSAPSAPKSAAPVKAGTASSESPGAPDTDNVQSGDQTTPDKAAGSEQPDAAGEKPESAGEKPESAGETGSEVPDGDGPGGHADEPGNPNADHQFNGQE